MSLCPCLTFFYVYVSVSLSVCLYVSPLSLSSKHRQGTNFTARNVLLGCYSIKRTHRICFLDMFDYAGLVHLRSPNILSQILMHFGGVRSIWTIRKHKINVQAYHCVAVLFVSVVYYPFLFLLLLMFVFHLTSRTIFSTICLLILPSSVLHGFMSLQLGLFSKFGLWSLWVINASLFAVKLYHANVELI